MWLLARQRYRRVNAPEGMQQSYVENYTGEVQKGKREQTRFN